MTAGQPSSAALSARLRQLPEQFPDLPLLVDVTDLHGTVPGPVADVVLRALHPLLTNVREHASARRVLLRAWSREDGWDLVLVDDGAGFDPASSRGGRGLSRFSREILEPVGVRMSVDSSPGRGTGVRLSARRPDPPARRPTHRARARLRRPAPGPGLPRSLWLVHGGVGAVLATAWLFLVASAVTAADPRLLAFGVVALAALTAAWWAQPPPSERWALPSAVLAVALGAVMALVSGDAGVTDDKLGIVVATFGCFVLAARVPRLRWWASALALPQAFLAARAGPTFGAVVALWAVIGVHVAAMLAESLVRFGTDADANRERRGAAERQAGALLVERQLAALRRASADGDAAAGRPHLVAAVDDAEAYLGRGREHGPLTAALRTALDSLDLAGGSIDVRLDDKAFEGDHIDPGEVAATVCSIVAVLHRHGARRISVRGVRSQGRLGLTVLGEPVAAAAAADLAAIALGSGARPATRTVADGSLLVSLELGG